MMVIEYLLNALKQTLLILAYGVLPYIVFALFMQWCANAIRKRLASLIGVKRYVYLTAPGVVVHELGHALFCPLFRHRIVEMKFFSPQPDGTLGYVNHRYDPGSRFQRIGNFFIGTGPIWLGLAVLYLVSLLLLPANIYGASGSIRAFLSAFFSLAFWSRWQSWLWLYLFLSVGSHVTLSPPDIRGAGDGAMALIVTVLIFELLFSWCAGLNVRCLHGLHGLWCGTLGPMTAVVGIMLLFSLILVVFKRGN